MKHGTEVLIISHKSMVWNLNSLAIAFDIDGVLQNYEI